METETTIDRAAAIAALGLTVDAVFVPFSRSRNKGEKSPSLNWRVTAKRNGRDVLTTDYSAGMAHCPGYAKKPPTDWDRPARFWVDAVCKFETEAGLEAQFSHWRGFTCDKSKPILPNPLDVLYSLSMDARVIHCATFEDWAMDYGYDPDSRKAETIYRACLETALKLCAAMGTEGMAQLAAIFEDY